MITEHWLVFTFVNIFFGISFNVFIFFLVLCLWKTPCSRRDINSAFPHRLWLRAWRSVWRGFAVWFRDTLLCHPLASIAASSVAVEIDIHPESLNPPMSHKQVLPKAHQQEKGYSSCGISVHWNAAQQSRGTSCTQSADGHTEHKKRDGQGQRVDQWWAGAGSWGRWGGAGQEVVSSGGDAKPKSDCGDGQTALWTDREPPTTL